MEKYCELRENCMVVHVPRELDHHQAGKLKMEADLLIDTCQVRRLIFDFSGTEFMDSSGIGVIIGRCRSMGYHGGEVFAENMNERLKKIFQVSGLHKIVRTDWNGQPADQRGMESR